jgi:hypothetical protein
VATHKCSVTTPAETNNETQIGRVRAASRWVVEHAGLGTLLTALPVGRLCVGQGWLADGRAQDSAPSHRGQRVRFRLFDALGWTLIIGAGTWLRLRNFSRREIKTPFTGSDTDWWRFDPPERERIFEGRFFSPHLLWIRSLVGLVGLALDVLLALKRASVVGRQNQFLSRRRSTLGLVLLPEIRRDEVCTTHQAGAMNEQYLIRVSPHASEWRHGQAAVRPADP